MVGLPWMFIPANGGDPARANMMKQLDEAVDSDVQSTLSALDSLCDAPVPLPNSRYLHGFGTVSSWFLHILWSSFSKWSVRSDSDTGSGNHCGLSGKIEVPKTIYQYDQSQSSSNLFSLPCIYNSWNLGPNKSPSLFESRETNGSSVGKHGFQRFSRAQRLSFRPALAKVTELCWGFHQSWKSSCTGHDGILMGFSVMFWWRLTLKKNRWLHQVGTQRC